MSRLFLVSIFTLSFSFSREGVASPVALTADQRADRLYWQFDALADEFTLIRKQTAVAALVSGIGLGATGGIMLAKGGSPSWKNVGAVGAGFGAGLAVGGALLFFVHGPYEKRAGEVFKSAQSLRGQARLDAYENSFHKLAEDERATREMGSLVTLLFGAGTTVAGFAIGDSSGTPTGAFFTLLGPTLIALSVVNYFIPGQYESKWETYKKNGELALRRVKPKFEFGISPTQNGGLVVASLKF